MLCEGNFAKLRFLLLPLASARVTRRAFHPLESMQSSRPSAATNRPACIMGLPQSISGNDAVVEVAGQLLAEAMMLSNCSPQSSGGHPTAQSRTRTHRTAKVITTKPCRGFGNARMITAASMLLWKQVDVWTACEAHVLPLSASESRFSCFCPSKSMAMGESISALGCVRPQSNGRDAPRGVQRAQKRGGTLNIARGGLEALLLLSSRRPCLHVAWPSTQSAP